MQILAEQSIHDAETSSAGQPYSVYVQTLKELGVDNYEVIVNGGHRTFEFSNGQKIHIKGECSGQVISNDLDVDSLASAIKRRQQGISDYSDFLKEIAHAGVHSYIADLRGMEVIYKGKNAIDFYAENIPKS
jgi:uncharacterized protein YbcV (DUF1398 family)